MHDVALHERLIMFDADVEMKGGKEVFCESWVLFLIFLYLVGNITQELEDSCLLGCCAM